MDWRGSAVREHRADNIQPGDRQTTQDIRKVTTGLIPRFDSESESPARH